MANGLKISEKGFKGDLASALLMTAMLGLALISIFMAIEAVKHRFSMLYPGLFGLALLCAIGGGALSRNWTDAWRAVLNGAVIASGYMSVYFLDALIEDRAARNLPTLGWMALSAVGLAITLKGLQRLPPPPLDADAFH